MKNQRNQFTIPRGKTFLNCAYMSPLAKRVQKAGLAGIKRKGNPLSITPSDFFNDANALRNEFSKLINNARSERIAIISSASYGLSTVAANIDIQPNQSIIITAGQFPSNVYPWMRLAERTKSNLKTIAPPSTLENRGKIWNEKILQAIDSSTKVVALGHVHWTDGTKFNLLEIRKRTREVGALLIIDGTQSVGALPFNVQEINPDALICAGYKWLMGPYSSGLGYYGPYFDKGKPLEENWITRLNSEDFAGLVKYQDEYQPGSIRYDMGERSNFIGLPMQLEALRMVNGWKPHNIQAYCKKITATPLNLLRENDWWIEDEEFRAHHLFGIRPLESKPMESIRTRLLKSGISVSFRGDAIRVAPHVYNTEKELLTIVRTLS